MCKSSNEPGGPRRCSADPRAQLQRSRDRVAQLERRRDALAAQIEALTAHREQLTAAIDDEHHDLHDALTGTAPHVVTSDRDERIQIGYSVETARMRVSVDWTGALGAVQWAGRVDLHVQDAIMLADALSEPPPEPWQLRRLALPRSALEVLTARQSPLIEGPITLDVIERGEQGGESNSHTLRLGPAAVRSLSNALRHTAGGISAARGEVSD